MTTDVCTELDEAVERLKTFSRARVVGGWTITQLTASLAAAEIDPASVEVVGDFTPSSYAIELVLSDELRAVED